MRFTSLSPVQDRAIHELLQGRPIELTTDQGIKIACTAIDTSSAIPLRTQGFVLLSAPRAKSLGYKGDTALALPIDPANGPEQLRFLMQSKVKIDIQPVELPDFSDALLLLAKQGRLIPAFYIAPISADAGQSLIGINQAELTLSRPAIAPQRVSTVPIPLHVGGHHIDVSATLYNMGVLGEEPLALSIGDTHSVEAPLVRLHSACLTGDVFGSLRCDCGPQLHQALATMNDANQGCLLYLPQEGRDTGLHNKLRAYALQDAGLDTVDADAALGFEPDERDFAMAAALLTDLGLTKIRLLTNNPDKVSGIEAEGIEVVERVPLQIPPQEHNHAYLKTKATRAGHYLPK